VDVNDDFLAVEAGCLTWDVDLESGRIQSAAIDDRPILIGGPHLMVLPLKGGACRPDHRTDIAPFNATCTEWKAESVETDTGDGAVTVRVTGRYKEAAGSYTLRIDHSGPDRGVMSLSYRFECHDKVAPRQIGMVFDLPRACDRLSWKPHRTAICAQSRPGPGRMTAMPSAPMTSAPPGRTSHGRRCKTTRATVCWCAPTGARQCALGSTTIGSDCSWPDSPPGAAIPSFHPTWQTNAGLSSRSP
jgi:hypothetical protein